MVSAISAIGGIGSVGQIYLPHAVPRIARRAKLPRTRIVEKPLEVDQLNKINEFIAIQKAHETAQLSNVNKTSEEPKDMFFGSNNFLSIYKEPVPAISKDLLIAYNGLQINQK